MGVIFFDGRSSKDAGIEVESPPSYRAAERVYEVVHVPGRDGDIIHDTGCYKNVNQDYDISFVIRDGESYTEACRRLLDFLHSNHGYARLEDSYSPDYFMEAFYKNETQISNIMQEGGKGTITFERKPERWLKVGQEPIIASNGKSIYNPTSQEAKPLLKITSSGNGSIMFVGPAIVNNYIGLVAEDSGFRFQNDLTDKQIEAIAVPGKKILIADLIYTVANPAVTYVNGVPYFHVEEDAEYDSGDSVTVCNSDITEVKIVNSYSGTLLFDCKKGDAYLPGVNLNSYVKSVSYPILYPEYNKIIISGGITELLITPRWWTL